MNDLTNSLLSEIRDLVKQALDRMPDMGEPTPEELKAILGRTRDKVMAGAQTRGPTVTPGYAVRYVAITDFGEPVNVLYKTMDEAYIRPPSRPVRVQRIVIPLGDDK